MHHEIPLLCHIAQTTRAISGSMTVHEVIECFQLNATLLALPVENDGRLEGLTSRRDLFLQHLAKPFARDLYYRKPIRMLLDPDPLVMPAHLNVNQGLEELLRRDPRLESDCFGIMEDGRCSGIVSVADLMMTISGLQARLLETLEQLSKRIRSEIEMAQRIQTGLLPVTPARYGQINVAAGLVNSTEISGDFYDLFLPDGSRLGLMVADVTGHGVQAGLVTTAAKAGLQILLDNGITRPGELLRGMNRAIAATGGQQLMMTALIALLDPEKQQLILASAGHPYPWRYAAADGSWNELPLDPGFPLGFDDTASYPEAESLFCPGDKLLMFSDGIIEAENRMSEAFGTVRFRQVLQEGRLLGSEQLKNLLLDEARRFTGNREFEDDVTLLIASCEKKSVPCTHHETYTEP
jgi:serine phosphatase RsbU (regulator of sigma subunit)/CBS domain-containing protein